MNDKLEPVLDLAEKVEATPDAKAYTFTPREGLVFDDGTPLTSRDVAFSIEVAVDKEPAVSGVAASSPSPAPGIWRPAGGDDQRDRDARPAHDRDHARPPGRLVPDHPLRYSGFAILPGAYPQGCDTRGLGQHPFHGAVGRRRGLISSSTRSINISSFAARDVRRNRPASWIASCCRFAPRTSPSPRSSGPNWTSCRSRYEGGGAVVPKCQRDQRAESEHDHIVVHNQVPPSVRTSACGRR